MTTLNLTAANQNLAAAIRQKLDDSGLNAEIDYAFPVEHSPAQRALLMAEAKRHYEVLFPETKAGAAQGLASRRAHGKASGQILAPAFVTVVVERAKGRRGWCESSVKQVVMRGEYISPDLLRTIVDDEEFDTGTRLDELVGIDRAFQEEHYRRWKSGEPPPPVVPAPAPPDDSWWVGLPGVIDNGTRFHVPQSGIDLYLGKCEDHLPSLTRNGPVADLVASDVPYGIDYKNGVIANDNDAEETAVWAVPLTLSALKPDGFAFVCTRWDVAPVWTRHHALHGAPVASRIVWDKKCPNGRPSPFVSRTEDILVARKGSPDLRDWTNDPMSDFGDESLHMAAGFEDKDVGRIVKADIDLWPIPVPRGGGAGEEHDTRKPVAMGIRMIWNGSNAGDVVLDPFMGTGPFAVAAVLTGRHFIGIELEPHHFAEAVRRVKAALRHVGQATTIAQLAA